VNFHWYEPRQDTSRQTVDTTLMGWAITMLACATNKTIITNEIGQWNHSATIPVQYLRAANNRKMPFMVWYSGDDGGSGGGAVALQDTSTTLRSNGVAFAAFMTAAQVATGGGGSTSGQIGDTASAKTFAIKEQQVYLPIIKKNYRQYLLVDTSGRVYGDSSTVSGGGSIYFPPPSKFNITQRKDTLLVSASINQTVTGVVVNGAWLRLKGSGTPAANEAVINSATGLITFGQYVDVGDYVDVIYSPIGSSSGSSGGNYHLPYNGNSGYYLGGDSALHLLPAAGSSFAGNADSLNHQPASVYAAAYSSVTALNDSSFTLNRINGTKDTITIAGVSGSTMDLSGYATLIFTNSTYATLSALATTNGNVSSNTTAIAGKLTAGNNLSDVASITTARTNLGLGTAATQNSTAFEVPLTISTGLTRTTNTVTNNLVTGIAGGQTALGGTAANEILVIQGNSATAGNTAANANVQFKVGNSGATTAVTIANNGQLQLTPASGVVPLTLSRGVSGDMIQTTFGSVTYNFNPFDGTYSNEATVKANSSAGLSLISTANNLNFYSNNTKKWVINSTGHFLANTDNTYDIGQSGASRPRNLFIAGTGIFGSTLTTAGKINAFAAKTAAYTLTATDEVIKADATTATFAVTLPTAVGKTGQEYTIKKVDATANAVTIATTSSQTIDGSTTYSLAAQWKYVKVISDNSNWIIVANN
jgi:hypothetical protein